MTSIKVYILGLGRIGALGIENAFGFMSKQTHLGYVLNDSRFELVGAWDTNEVIRARINSKLNNQICLTDDFKSVNADIFVISTPASTHYELISKIIQYKNSKLILCETPLGKNLTDAKNIQQELINNNVNCMINYPRSYSIANSKKISKLQFEVKKKQFFYINATIADRSKSSLWHFVNLLLRIDNRFDDLIESNITKSENPATVKYTLNTKNFTLNITLLKLIDSSYAEVVFLFEGVTYWLLDGNSKLYKSEALSDMGWRSFPAKKKPIADLLSDSMELFYSEAFKFMNDKKYKINDVERAIKTHKLINLIEEA